MDVQVTASTSIPEPFSILPCCHHHLVSPSHHILSFCLIPAIVGSNSRHRPLSPDSDNHPGGTSPAASWQQRLRVPASLCAAKGKPRTFLHLLPWDEPQPSGINTTAEVPQAARSALDPANKIIQIFQNPAALHITSLCSDALGTALASHEAEELQK